MAEPNNPADRLYNILVSAKSLSKEKALSAWSKLLSVPEDDKAELLRRLGLVLELPAKIREQIEQIPEIDKKLFLKWIPEVEKGFGQLNLSRPFSEFINPISDKALHGLEFCSEQLSRSFPEKVLDRKELDKLSRDILALMDRVSKTEMSEELKRFILDKLSLIHQAINDYDISGPAPLQKAVESIVGGEILNKKNEEMNQHPDIKKRFWGIVYKATIVLTLFVNAAELPNSFTKLLPEFKEKGVSVIQEKEVVDSGNSQASLESKNAKTMHGESTPKD